MRQPLYSSTRAHEHTSGMVTQRYVCSNRCWDEGGQRGDFELVGGTVGMPEMIISESGFTLLLFKLCTTLVASTVGVGTVDLLGGFIKNRKPTAVKQGQGNQAIIASRMRGGARGHLRVAFIVLSDWL